MKLKINDEISIINLYNFLKKLKPFFLNSPLPSLSFLLFFTIDPFL